MPEFTKTYHWFFCDIVSSANPAIPTLDQREKIKKFYDIISKIPIMRKKDSKRVIVPTGDGYVVGFSDSYDKPVTLAIDLLKDVAKYNKTKKTKEKLNLRIGIDTGPVYELKDSLTKNNAFWGPGIIMAKRVMDLAGENQIFASKDIAEKMKNLSKEHRNLFHPVGKYQIKHNEQVQIYNIYGKGFGNKHAPKKSKIIKKKETFEQELKSKSAFIFNTIDAKVDILQSKSMLTRHVLNWNLINISKEPKDQIFYYIDGDVPRDFKDLNIKIIDDDGKKLDIMSVSVNKPLHKEFTVRMNKPLKPRQRNKSFKLEYDWEEPERSFFYKLPTNCKKFTYTFSCPKDLDVKNRVLKIDTELGYKWLAEPPSKLEYKSNKTIISWEGKNLKAHDAFKFEW